MPTKRLCCEKGPDEKSQKLARLRGYLQKARHGLGMKKSQEKQDEDQGDRAEQS